MVVFLPWHFSVKLDILMCCGYKVVNDAFPCYQCSVVIARCIIGSLFGYV